MNGPSRHKACNYCREKKIRCNGGQPCARCQNTAEQCTYSYSAQPKQSKAVLSSTVVDLREKLREAEAALQYRLPQHPSPANLLEQNTDGDINDSLWQNNLTPSYLAHPVGHATANPALFGQAIPLSQPAYSGDFSAGEYRAAPALAISPTRTDVTLFDSFAPQSSLATAEAQGNLAYGDTCSDQLWASSPRTISSPQSLNWSNPNQNPACDFVTPQISMAVPESVGMLPQAVVNDLFQCYFSTLHYNYPMVDKTRFRNLIGETTSRSEIESLKYAIWAHAAVLSPPYVQMSEKLYRQARTHIEAIDRDADQGFFTISALQALILIALYEIKQTCFTRAWASVARATCLAHALSLHTMDSASPLGKGNGRRSLLSRTSDPLELEERRRTFWVVLQINCFSSISTYLPQEETRDEKRSSRRITLAEVLKFPIRGVLTPWQGTTLAACLCIRCVSHHHQLNDIIRNVCAPSLAHLKIETYTAEPHVVSLNMIIQTTIICLHQAVIYRVSKTKAPNHSIQESESCCREAAISITGIVRYMGPNNIAQMDPFIPWTFYVTLQYLLRTTESKQPSPSSHSQAESQLSEPASTYGYASRRSSSTTSERSNGSVTGNGSVSGRSTPQNSTSTGHSVLNKGQLLDSIEMLRFGLSALKATNSLANVFEAQINEEIEGGEEITKERLVGLVDFFSKGL